MVDVIVYHHAQGLTEGVRAFADDLRAAGHRVMVPDLYDGKTFQTLDEGLGYLRQVGFATVRERGLKAVEGLPTDMVYAGFSLGAMPAQELAQTRPGARGALLFYSAVPASEFDGPWPKGVSLQIHGMDADPIFVDEGDLAAARELLQMADDAELFLYPGDQHLFADRSLKSYDEAAATVLMQRVLDFLDRVG